jgi:hypothetical protein
MAAIRCALFDFVDIRRGGVLCRPESRAVVRRREERGRVGRERPHPQAARCPSRPAPGVAHVPLVGELVIIAVSGDVARDLLRLRIASWLFF